jgi:hypothetical protein
MVKGNSGLVRRGLASEKWKAKATQEEVRMGTGKIAHGKK